MLLVMQCVVLLLCSFCCIEGVLTGERDFPDLFSTTSEMTVMFFSDSSGGERGFLANFSTGFNLGQPGKKNPNEQSERSGPSVQFIYFKSKVQIRTS